MTFIYAFVRDTPLVPVFIRHHAIIDSVIVKTGFQNHGTGKMLMDKILFR
jgi:hypothetical protein